MPTRYTAPAILLHWLMAAGLAGVFALGVYMHELPFSPAKLQWYAWHKWAGVSLFLLALLRLAWRLGHRPPPLPDTLPAWQARLAGGVHLALYGLMLAIPLSGWLMSSAKGVSTVWFGILPLPDLVARDPILGDRLLVLHQGLNFSLLGLVLLHAGAALWHHLFMHDAILLRMWPTRQARRQP